MSNLLGSVYSHRQRAVYWNGRAKRRLQPIHPPSRFLVAPGKVELFCDPICGAYWDYAPMTVIIPEAGGRLTQFDGSAIGDWTSAIASNALLHEAARKSF